MVREDQPRIVYQGPPRWDGRKWLNGDKFVLSGKGKGDLGVELAGAVAGLDRGAVEYRYDAGANTPGSRLTSQVAGRREMPAAINILGDTSHELARNKQRWEQNHPDKRPGRLWVLSEFSAPKYLEVFKSEVAGTATLDKDPFIRNVYEDWEWGWTSDHPYFFGYEEVRELEPQGGGKFSESFFNDSTAPQVYPKLVLYGPGRFEIDAGYGREPILLPDLAAGQMMRVNYDATEKTLLRQPIDGSGPVTNIWPLLRGQRPRMSFDPQSHTTVTVTNRASGTPARNPELIYTPEFVSWV